MGTKRPHTDLSDVHASRKATFQPYDSHAHKRARKADHFTSNRPSTNLLRKKIRDTTRLLNHSTDLPADTRIEYERALAGYKQDIEAVEEGKRKSKLISRYHMVRFFERQKATRHLKKLRKRLADATDAEERKATEALVHVAEVDLNYAVYCPLEEKYVGLYPQKREDEDEEEVVARHVGEKPWLPLWKVVERRMEDGTLEALRNGTGQGEGLGGGGDEVEGGVGLGGTAKRSDGMPIRSKRKNGREERVGGRGRRDEEEGSDGRFFEE